MMKELARTTDFDPADIKLSMVSSVKDTATKETSLLNVFEVIKSPKYERDVCLIRNAIARGGKANASALKQRLPGFLFAGTFTRRKSEAIQQHSGLLVLDFDDVDIGKKAGIASDPHAVLTFVSPSGNGLKCVIRIDPDPATHAASFDAASTHFREQHGLEADPSGRDLARLCFVSYDPDAVLNLPPGMLHRPHMTIQDDTDYAGDRGKPPPSGERTPEQNANDTALCGLCNIDDVLAQTQPTQPGQRHAKVFALARGIRFDCGLADTPLKELKPIVRRWHKRALPNIATLAFDETWADFLHAWGRVKTPLAECPVDAAWKKVNEGDAPPVANEYESPKVKALISLCWHLSKPAGEFYLSMHTAGNLLGVKPFSVQRWLRMITADEVIELVHKGRIGKATTYRWTAKSATAS